MIEPLEELVNLGIDFRVGPRQEPVEIVVYEMVGHGAYLIGPSQGNEFTYWFNSLILASRFKYFERRRQIKSLFETETARAAANYAGERAELYRGLKLEGLLDAPQAR